MQLTFITLGGFLRLPTVSNVDGNGLWKDIKNAGVVDRTIRNENFGNDDPLIIDVDIIRTKGGSHFHLALVKWYLMSQKNIICR